MYNILRLGENFHLVMSRNKDHVYPISQLWTSPLHPFVENIKEIFNWFWKLSPSVLIVFLLVVLIINIKHIKKKPKGELILASETKNFQEIFRKQNFPIYVFRRK